MVEYTQTIRRLLPMNCLSVFDHFAGLALEGLILRIFTRMINGSVLLVFALLLCSQI